MNAAQYRTSAIIGPGFSICGIAPTKRLVTIETEPCWNCQGTHVLRQFSGSGWYEDNYLCPDCGEDVGTGYRPFKRAWRKDNIARATQWRTQTVPRDEFFALTSALIKEEMGWDDDTDQARGNVL